MVFALRTRRNVHVVKDGLVKIVQVQFVRMIAMVENAQKMVASVTMNTQEMRVNSRNVRALYSQKTERIIYHVGVLEIVYMEIVIVIKTIAV